jgi:uncharacterized protein (DUF983 family)
MGCDMGSANDTVPYCTPKCGQFRLVVHLERVKAKCVMCDREYEFTVHGGQILIEQKERATIQ